MKLCMRFYTHLELKSLNIYPKGKCLKQTLQKKRNIFSKCKFRGFRDNRIEGSESDKSITLTFCNVVRILVGKPEEKRPLGRPSSRWVHNIKMDLREIGWGGMDWIDVVQGRDQ
jgi:hypothetical protein